jgi:Plavaka transposase
MTGDRTAHLLLISLANMKGSYRAKSSHHAFLLLALLPVPKFVTHDKALRGVLENRVLHACLDFILEPLKKAALLGRMMSDPYGSLRYCFTPLAAYIVDTPEAAMLAGVAGKTSHVTMAGYKQFGDSFRHEPRTASTTLAQLLTVEMNVNPNDDIKAYVKEAKKFQLSGVDKPFWRDWPLAEPSLFLTPEPLHHFNKEFYDHDLKWCIRMLGEAEIDFRFSILQPHIGFRHFAGGVSRLKQVTGREHRNIQRYIVAVIAGAAPRDFIIAIRSLMDFRYLAQAPQIDDTICTQIDDALLGFHDHKSAITDAKVRVGKGNRPIENWYIPKLELMQSVTPNIKANGAPINWSADMTEHAHIEVIKHPAKSGNNQKYEEQICRYLDRSEKCRRFDLATAIRDARMEFVTFPPSHLVNDVDTDDEDDISPESINPLNERRTDSSSTLLNNICTVSGLSQTRRAPTDYFQEAVSLVRDQDSDTPLPFRTFLAGSSTAIHLNREPFLRKKSINEIATMFCIPDLAPSLAHLLSRVASRSLSLYAVGGRRLPTAVPLSLPFEKLDVWHGMRLQMKDYHNPRVVQAPQALCAWPPSELWPSGRFDAALINTDPDKKWPYSKMSGTQ